ncbi:MAG: PorT family protein [Bacteroidetes Order II. Incertae sedis bacterium]|jgi:hypothetical protein|nr:PorT family protein [Bacteroidetes Order II. bacterium]MBT4602077.1 PorT family protein [Bacteroidetes Order II. bacterium]MBT5248664.1 PorT family protein [Bacteroidetes Order II. bacterium]MBT6200451.1 PorT family protein [Bacteroidetes Order II. bacterium]MBT6425506.1 PorT family protein [Bacteroidetes Order II. bacterium]
MINEYSKGLFSALTVLTLAMVAPNCAEAQFRALMQAGVSGSSFRGDTVKNASYIKRLVGGGGLRYEYPSGFEFETGVYYLVKGGALKFDFEDIPIEGLSEITYIEVPFLLGYRINPYKRISPRLFAGPAMAFKTEAQITYNAVGSSFEQTEQDLTVEGQDLGLIVGLDFNARVGSETLTFGLRSTYGLSNARSEKPEIYNTSYVLMAGIIF